MEWKKGRRGGNVDDRRGASRIEALLARSPTYRRETSPGLNSTSPRMRDSMVSDAVRERSRGRAMNKGGAVTAPKAQKGGPNYVKPYYHGHDEGTPPSKPRGKFAAGGSVGDGCVVRGKTKGKNR